MTFKISPGQRVRCAINLSRTSLWSSALGSSLWALSSFLPAQADAPPPLDASGAPISQECIQGAEDVKKDWVTPDAVGCYIHALDDWEAREREPTAEEIAEGDAPSPQITKESIQAFVLKAGEVANPVANPEEQQDVLQAGAASFYGAGAVMAIVALAGAASAQRGSTEEETP